MADEVCHRVAGRVLTARSRRQAYDGGAAAHEPDRDLDRPGPGGRRVDGDAAAARADLAGVGTDPWRRPVPGATVQASTWTPLPIVTVSGSPAPTVIGAPGSHGLSDPPLAPAVRPELPDDRIAAFGRQRARRVADRPTARARPWRAPGWRRRTAARSRRSSTSRARSTGRAGPRRTRRPRSRRARRRRGAPSRSPVEGRGLTRSAPRRAGTGETVHAADRDGDRRRRVAVDALVGRGLEDGAELGARPERDGERGRCRCSRRSSCRRSSRSSLPAAAAGATPIRPVTRLPRSRS